jgi:S-methylmethionine-dependent homocysteine/selenocysteine methylase
MTTMRQTAGYRRIADKLGRGGLVILDGGIASELQHVGYPQDLNLGELWGVRALYSEQGLAATREVHRRYLAAGAEVLMTNTFRLDVCPAAERDGRIDAPPGTWRDLVGRSVDLVRAQAAEAGREGEVAVAFVQARPSTVDPDWLRELSRLIGEARPDLMIMEANQDLPADLRFPEYETLMESGVPLWVSYRRVVGGTVGLYGEIRERDGDRFQRAVERFEAIGIQAVLVHCLPALSVEGVIPWLREATSLPLGVYANTGRFTNPGWDFSLADTPEEYLEYAKDWAAQGARIIGGCCGVGPAHIEALARELPSQAARMLGA